MAHGIPDWSQTAGAVTTYQLSDLAELAARLGSIVTYDRRGEVILLEHFSDGLIRWSTESSGAGATADVSAAESRTGPFSARIVAGSDANKYCRLRHRMALPALSGIGLESSFNLPSYVDAFTIALYIYDGSYYTIYSVQWDETNRILKYLPASGPYVTLLAGQELGIQATLFHTLKLVVRSDLREYARILLNAYAFDLSDVGAYNVPSTSVPYLEARVQVDGRAAHNDAVYVDDVIVTQNEPPQP